MNATTLTPAPGDPVFCGPAGYVPTLRDPSVLDRPPRRTWEEPHGQLGGDFGRVFSRSTWEVLTQLASGDEWTLSVQRAGLPCPDRTTVRVVGPHEAAGFFVRHDILGQTPEELVGWLGEYEV